MGRKSKDRKAKGRGKKSSGVHWKQEVSLEGEWFPFVRAAVEATGMWRSDFDFGIPRRICLRCGALGRPVLVDRAFAGACPVHARAAASSFVLRKCYAGAAIPRSSRAGDGVAGTA